MYLILFTKVIIFNQNMDYVLCVMCIITLMLDSFYCIYFETINNL